MLFQQVDLVLESSYNKIRRVLSALNNKIIGIILSISSSDNFDV